MGYGEVGSSVCEGLVVNKDLDCCMERQTDTTYVKKLRKLFATIACGFLALSKRISMGFLKIRFRGKQGSSEGLGGKLWHCILEIRSSRYEKVKDCAVYRTL